MPREDDIFGDVLTDDVAAIEAPDKDVEADKTATAENTVVVEEDVDSLAGLEETPEEKAEREAQEAAEEKKRNIRIPKARFDEVREKAKAREAELKKKIAELEHEKNVASYSADIKAAQKSLEDMQDKYEDLIMDGLKDEARKLRKEMDLLRDNLIEHKTAARAEAARKAAVEDLRFDQTLARLEASHPALNPDSEDFDKEKTDEVAELMDVFRRSGASQTAALERAVKYVMGSSPTAPTKGETKDLFAARAEAARKKAAEANKRQPASTARVGLDSDKAGSAGAVAGIDIMKMSQAKFAKIDEETLAKLRGDEL